MRKGTELGQLRNQGSREIRTDAGDGLEEISLRRPDGALADALVQIGIDIGQLTLKPGDVPANALLHRFQREAETVLLLGEHADDLRATNASSACISSEGRGRTSGRTRAAKRASPRASIASVFDS